jgi:hypothetical protein
VVMLFHTLVCKICIYAVSKTIDLEQDPMLYAVLWFPVLNIIFAATVASVEGL